MRYFLASLGSFPLKLACFENASVAFVPTHDNPGIIDQGEGMTAEFYAEFFRIGKEEYDYNVQYLYKDIPDMLQWLQQQKIEMPFQ